MESGQISPDPWTGPLYATETIFLKEVMALENGQKYFNTTHKNPLLQQVKDSVLHFFHAVDQNLLIREYEEIGKLKKNILLIFIERPFAEKSK